MTQRKKQVRARCGTAGVWGPASKERFSEITSGRSGGQQGLVTTCKDSFNEAKTEVEESPLRLANESVGATKEE
jgi:hypothetical protein